MNVTINGDNFGIVAENVVMTPEGVEVNNLHDDRGRVRIVAEEATPEAVEAIDSWEDCIPEYLRSGLLRKAWDELRSAGILSDDFQLAPGVSKSAGKYIVERFCQKRQQNEWKPFEKFWHLEELRRAGNDFSAVQKNKISAIFREL